MGKRELRREMFARAARRYDIPVVYVNQVGGNDQLVFDGSSFAMDAAGQRHRVRRRRSQEDLVVVDVDTRRRRQHARHIAMNARRSMRRWCSGHATTSANADSGRC